MERRDRKDWLTVRHPALEDLKRLFEGKWTVVPKTHADTEFDLRLDYTHQLNDKESIDLEFRRSDGHDQQYITCLFKRDGDWVFSFSINENGLQVLGVAKLGLSFNESEKVLLKDKVGITEPRGLTALHYDREDADKFVNLGYEVVDWVKKVVQEGKIGEIPFSITPINETPEPSHGTSD